MSSSVTSRGPGLGALFDWLEQERTSIIRELAQVEADAIRDRAFGPAGLGSDGQPHPRGVDLEESGAMRRGLGVVHAEGAEAFIGGSGRSVAYFDRVNRRTPFLEPTAGDLAKVAQAFPDILNRHLQPRLGGGR